MNDCLSDEQFERLATGMLPSSEAASLQAHLESCSACRETLEECRANRHFETAVRDALGAPINGAPLLLEQEKAAAHDTPPDQIRGYSIGEEIHRGAQGLIYAAVQQSTGRKVAIKFLREGLYASPSSQRRFEREIDVAARLVHPNIIRVFDSGVTPSGRHYYVMDYVQGLPLHHYVWDGRLTLEETLRLFVMVCEAVNFAHQRGVIHRDLKPSNILVDAEGVPRILDFGLAKQVVSQSDTMLSLTGQVMGTLPFMSPEQAAGGREQIDIRADVYALGVILYLIVTGKYPYPVSGPITEVLRHIAQTPPLAPRKAWAPDSGVPPLETGHERSAAACPIREDLQTILLTALAKEPERRYQNVAMLTADLSRHLGGEPIEARRELGLLALRRTLSQYKAVTALSVLCVLLIGISTQTLWWMYQSQSRERERYEAERSRAVQVQSELTQAILLLGDRAMSQGDLETAAGQYLAALTMGEHLLASDLTSAMYQERLARTLLRLGDVARLRGEADQAAGYYRRLGTLADQLSARAAPGVDYSDLLDAAKERLKGISTRPEADSPPSQANERGQR